MTFTPNPSNSVKSTKNSTTQNISGICHLKSDLTKNNIASLEVENADVFLDSGLVRINQEYIKYTQKDGLLLIGLTRGCYDSSIQNHSTGDEIIGTYIGKSERNSSPDIMVSIKCDRDCLFYFELSDNDEEWNSYPILGHPIANNSHYTLINVIGGRYFRIRIENQNKTATTKVSLTTYYGTFNKTSLYTANNDTWTGGASTVSLTGAIRNDSLSTLASLDDEVAPLQVDNKGALYTMGQVQDIQMKSHAHVSHYGALKTSGTHPVVTANFSGDEIDRSKWTDYSCNGSCIIVHRGVGELHTNTNSNGICKVVSNLNGLFEAGQITVYQSGVYAGYGCRDSYKRWGLLRTDSSNGLFFEWASKTYYMLLGHVKQTTSTTIQLSDLESSTDDIYTNKCYIYIYGGTGAGQNREVKSYIGSTRVATVDEWDVIPDETSLYIITGHICQSTDTTAKLGTYESTIDNHYQNYFIVICKGTGKGQYRIINNYDAETQTVTVTKWFVIPDKSSRYYIFKPIINASQNTVTIPSLEPTIPIEQYDMLLVMGSGTGQHRKFIEYQNEENNTLLVDDWESVPYTDTFQVVARQNFLETATTLDNFNGEKWSPTNKNNTYRIHYSAGRAIFQRSLGGQLSTLHIMVNGDYPLVSNLNMGLFYESGNLGSTKDQIMRVRGASTSIFGNPPKPVDKYLYIVDDLLSAGQRINSDIMDLKGYSQIQLEIYSDVSGMLYGEWYSDPYGKSFVREFNFPYTKERLETIATLVLTRYVRYFYTNGDANQKQFMIKFKGLTKSLSGQIIGLNSTVVPNMVANLGRNLSMGQQPDGDFVNLPADGEALSTSNVLGENEFYQSQWIDTDGWNSIELFITTDVPSQFKGLKIEFTDDSNAPNPIVRAVKSYSFTRTDVIRGFNDIRLTPILDGFRITYLNNNLPQSKFYLSVTLKVNSSNHLYNKGQALISSDFLSEVALGNVPNYQVISQYGRNNNVSIGNVDVWENGGIYSGHPIDFEPSTVTVVSTSRHDSLSETGAWSIQIKGLKTPQSLEYETEDIDLNGVNSVQSRLKWWRIISLHVLKSGILGHNDGDINAYATSNPNIVFGKITNTLNQSIIGVFTVPSGKNLLIKRIKIYLNKRSGNSSSAFITLRARETGCVYRSIASYDCQTSNSVDDTKIGGIICPSGTDLKFHIESVSTTNTIINTIMEFIILDL